MTSLRENLKRYWPELVGFGLGILGIVAIDGFKIVTDTGPADVTAIPTDSIMSTTPGLLIHCAGLVLVPPGAYDDAAIARQLDSNAPVDALPTFVYVVNGLNKQLPAPGRDLLIPTDCVVKKESLEAVAVEPRPDTPDLFTVEFSPADPSLFFGLLYVDHGQEALYRLHHNAPLA